VDNLESQIQTDHIGPFLFTKLVAKKVLESGTESYVPRVVFVSSTTHACGTGINFKSLGRPEPATYDSWDTYSQAKRANVLTGAVKAL
jgi:NAD(P)-dependent dehydrogenase (short-subunit alcohol dehydrogenase family)